MSYKELSKNSLTRTYELCKHTFQMGQISTNLYNLAKKFRWKETTISGEMF